MWGLWAPSCFLHTHQEGGKWIGSVPSGPKRITTSTRLHRSPPDTFKSTKVTRGDLLEGAGIYTRMLENLLNFKDLKNLINIAPSPTWTNPPHSDLERYANSLHLLGMDVPPAGEAKKRIRPFDLSFALSLSLDVGHSGRTRPDHRPSGPGPSGAGGIRRRAPGRGSSPGAPP